AGSSKCDFPASAPRRRCHHRICVGTTANRCVLPETEPSGDPLHGWLVSRSGYAKYWRPHGWRLLLSKFLCHRRPQHGWSGHRFHHPFEYAPESNTWTIKSAIYPDDQVSNMACGILSDSGTPYIYCVGGSAGGQTTATDRMFRHDPVADTIESIAAPWAGDSDGITLPGGFAVFNNKFYILGGFRINTAMTNQILEFT